MNLAISAFFAFAICGAFAGIAGLAEVSGPIGLLYRDISPNYGFTAIIVAFLGRLHPIGIIFASLVIELGHFVVFVAFLREKE